MPEGRTTCPDCQSDLQPIRMLDATMMYFNGQSGGHVEPAYAAIDAQASRWTKDVPQEGTVKAKICPDCGRILLFGSPSS